MTIVELIIIMQVFVALLGIVFYRKFEPKWTRLILLFLILSAANPYITRYYGKYIDVGNNYIIINAYYFITFSLLYYVFYRILEKPIFKKGVILFVALYFTTFILEFVLLEVDYHKKSQVIPFILGGFGIWLSIILYFIEIIESSAKTKPEKSIIFWFALAQFFYLIVFVMLKLNQNYLIVHKADYYRAIRNYTTLIFNIILIIGILWSGQPKKQ